MDYNTVRDAAVTKLGNNYELVTVIQQRVRELEKNRPEGVPTKGTELIQYVMEEILSGKLAVSEKEDLRAASIKSEE